MMKGAKRKAGVAQSSNSRPLDREGVGPLAMRARFAKPGRAMAAVYGSSIHESKEDQHVPSMACVC